MRRCYCGTSAAQISCSVSYLLLSVNKLTTQRSDYVKFHLFRNLSMATVGYNQSYVLCLMALSVSLSLSTFLFFLTLTYVLTFTQI